MSLTRRFVKTAGIAALFVAAALLGIASGVLFAVVGDLPQITALDNPPSTTTTVLGRDGSVIGEFAKERRELVRYEDIPVDLRDAILAAEDADFFKHFGLDVPRIGVALVKDILRRQASSGASTLTQQLARNLFPDTIGFAKTPARKIKEALVAIQIEKRYTKEEIFTKYCNQIYFGYGAYGVQAASRVYFDKPVQQLTLPEAALLAGIIQGNVSQSPWVNRSAAKWRRDYTLRHMFTDGYITKAQEDAALKAPLVVRNAPTLPRSIAPYFTELVRQHLEDAYGATAVYGGGLTVKTGLDPALQLAAHRALEVGLRDVDHLHGFRKPAHNVLAEGQSLDGYRDSAWTADPAAGDILPAVVTEVGAADIHVRIGRWQGTIDRRGYAWTRREPASLVRRGDLVEARVAKVDAGAATFTASLDQPPLVEGAVLALDNRTGQILAMVGGSDYQVSQFNRATQALRQVGSAFKPFVYTAAIDRGYTVTSTVVDQPVSFPVGPNQPPYEPQNYERDFKGPMTLETALEESRNVPAVELMAALGPEQVIKYARRFGITAPLPPYLSMAIGAGDISLLEMTSAYTVFPNQGVRMTPLAVLQVTDRNGNVLEQARSESHEAIRADTAYVLTTMLEDVVLHGTGAVDDTSDLRGKWPLGGKTGTTDAYSDAWFIGFDPDITVGVWVGYDQKKPLGQGQTGAVAALPIWADVMRAWVDRRSKELSEPPNFTKPGNVVLVATDTGTDAYIAGTQPGGKGH